MLQFELDPIKNGKIPFDPQTFIPQPKSFEEIDDPAAQNNVEKNDIFSLKELETKKDNFSFKNRNHEFSFDVEETSQIISSLSLSDQMLMDANKILTDIIFHPFSNPHLNEK